MRLLPRLLLVLAALIVCGMAPEPPQAEYSVPQVPREINKLGLSGGWPEGAETLGASWLYTWGPHPVGSDTVEAVPMIWGAWGSGGVPEVGGNSPWLMGWNEPDLPWQSNITPQNGALGWHEIEYAFPGRKKVAPAPSDGNIWWLPAMREAYILKYGVAPQFDALAFHCYRWNAAGCIAIGETFVAWAQEWGASEVWCTEFAFTRAHAEDPAAEARAFVYWLENEPLITRYSPFMSHIDSGSEWWSDARPEANPSLLDDDGKLTEVGGWYARTF